MNLCHNKEVGFSNPHGNKKSIILQYTSPHARFQRALTKDAGLNNEYKALDSKTAKEALKRKWALTVLSTESARKVQKTASNSQHQQQGRKGKWKTQFQLNRDEGGEVAAKIIRQCILRGKGWFKEDPLRGETIYWAPVEFGSDVNHKEFTVSETQDIYREEKLKHLIL
eukprot:6492288-Amphidinium_carterae.1